MNAPTHRDITNETGLGLAARGTAAHLLQACPGSEAEYRALFEALPHPIWVYDLETLAFLAVNEAAIVLSGYTREEYLVMTLRDVHSGDDLARLVFGLSAESTSGIRTVQGHHRRKDGIILDAELVFNSISFGGRRAGIVLALDLGRSLCAVTDPRPRGDLYRLLAEASRDIVFILGRDGIVQYVNGFAAQQFNARSQDLIGKARSDLFQGEVSKRQDQNLRRVFDTGQPCYVEHPSTFPGSILWLGTWLVPLKNEAGEVTSVVGTSRDITQRKQMDETLARRTRQLELLAQATQQINTVLEVPVVLRKLVTSAMELTGATVGMAGLVVQGEMVFSESNHRGVWITASSHFGRGYGPAGWVLEHWKPCLVTDASQDPLVPPELQKDPDLCCLANVPILDHRGELVGCVELHNPASERRFDETDLAMLQGLAASTGTALDNASMIEARKRTEAELRASEARLRLVTDNMVDVITQTGPEGLLEYASPSIERILGFELREILGRPVFERVHEEDRGRAETALRDAARERLASVRLEYRHRHANGHHVWLESETKLLYDHRGELGGAIFSSRDVTQRKVAEELLHVRSLALESAANAIFITDRGGSIIWCNQAFTRLTGYSLQEALGRTPSMLKSGRQSPDFYAQLWETVLAGDVWHGEMVNRRKDRSLFAVEQTVTPVLDAEGAITHFISIEQDVTERKRIESELRQSRERFQFIFQSNPAAIGISTLREGRYLDVNHSFLRLTGYSRDEVIGRTARELNLWTCPEDRALLLEHLREDCAVCNIESRFRTKSGEARDALESIQIIQLGLDLCVLFILTDITERKRLEEQLRHSQKMDAIGQLAGGVAHDFNNMLTVIQGHANMIGMQGNLSASASESVQEISQASERAANLTRQLLTFSRKQPMQARAVDLNEVVGNLTKMLRRIIGEHLSLEFRYSPQLPAVLADVGMIEQAVLNLAINARDAMSDGGRLVIGTEVRHVDPVQAGGRVGAREGEFVCLVVRDTGAGIPAAVLPRIFEPFFTTKEAGKGTGLGLATVQNVAQQHEGWVEVESVINVGTTFRIFLPARPEGIAEPLDLLSQSVPRGGSETILLVEDEEALRVLARQVLEHYGYDVWEASSGVAALEIWAEKSEKIQLLLTDIVMPGGLNGKELADRLRADRPDLKVILTTGYSTDAMRQPPLPGDRMPVLQKPYPPQVLAQTVRESLDQK